MEKNKNLTPSFILNGAVLLAQRVSFSLGLVYLVNEKQLALVHDGEYCLHGSVGDGNKFIAVKSHHRSWPIFYPHS